MIYKLKISTEQGIKDFYFDVRMITGFFIPEIEEDEEPGINIFFEGDMVTVIQEPHIINYLTKTFIQNSVKEVV